MLYISKQRKEYIIYTIAIGKTTEVIDLFCSKFRKVNKTASILIRQFYKVQNFINGILSFEVI